MLQFCIFVVFPATVAGQTFLAALRRGIDSAASFVEQQYDLFNYGGETPETCTFYDACDDPIVSSRTGDAAPGWLTSGTPYHNLCGDLGFATEMVTVAPNSSATTARQLGVTFPETPDCAPATHTSCGVNVTYDVPAIKLPTDTDAESGASSEALCVLRDLDTLADAADGFKDLVDPYNYAEYVYATVGNTGILQTWPGVEWGSCPSSYDPRYRPWYAGSAIGPKNVVLIMDYSLSMDGQNRRSLAEEAAARVLGTLNDNDYVGLVTFAATGDPYAPTLKPFTSNEACKLEEHWTGLRTEYLTNYQGAFDAAFDMLEASKETGDVAACDTTVFLFLSDGEVYGAGYDGQELRDHVKARNAAHGVRVLTYVLGDGTDATLANSLACDNYGAGYQIDDGSDLAGVMGAYFFLLTAQMVPGTLPAAWTRYRDFNSGNWVATLCKSAWDSPGFETSGQSQLYGVVCVDVAEAHIEAEEGSLAGLQAALEETRTTCPTFELATDGCALEQVRAVLPGSPALCGWDACPDVYWWYWGAPLIGVVVVAAAAAAVAYGPLIVRECRRCGAECEARRRGRQQDAHRAREEQRRMPSLPVEEEEAFAAAAAAAAIPVAIEMVGYASGPPAHRPQPGIPAMHGRRENQTEIGKR
jgi:hypothetical protein